MIRFPSVLALSFVAMMGGAHAAASPETFPREQLRVPTLTGWTAIANLNDPVGENSEWIPTGEKDDSWIRKISIQAFRGSPLTATEFLTLALDRSADVCDGLSASPIQALNTTSYDMGERVVYCYRYKGDAMGHTTLYWVLRGKQALYVVSLAWRTPPFTADSLPISDQQLREAQMLTRQITLCQKSSTGNSCM